MGHHPSADLFYGFDLREMTDDGYESTAPQWWQDLEDAGEYVDWEEELARRLGWVEAPRPEDWPERDNSIYRLQYDQQRAAREQFERVEDEWKKSSPAYQAWAASLKQKHALLAEIPVELDTYGHCDSDTYWAVRVKASVQHVYGCDSIALDPMEVRPEWWRQLQQFVDLLELNVPEDGPGWHLSVSWG